jgi:hypothetical protein
MKKRQTKKDRAWDAKFDLASRFEAEIFAHKDLCPIHDFTEVLAIALANHLKNMAIHQGLEAMDDELTQFVDTLSALVEPDPKIQDDPKIKFRVSLKIERENA